MATVQILNQRPLRHEHNAVLARVLHEKVTVLLYPESGRMHSIAASTSYFNATRKDVDGRDEPGHDARSRYGLISNSRAKAV